jgi:hypothetical protein
MFASLEKQIQNTSFAMPMSAIDALAVPWRVKSFVHLKSFFSSMITNNGP